MGQTVKSEYEGSCIERSYLEGNGEYCACVYLNMKSKRFQGGSLPLVTCLLQKYSFLLFLLHKARHSNSSR